MSRYDEAFFTGHAGGSRASAERVAAILAEVVPTSRVVDVGCGIGTWLAAFKQQGSSVVMGLDGDYVPRDSLQIDPAEFEAADLRDRLSVDGTFDVAMSLEVAEHLPPERGPTFVEDLTALAPVVLFSAAIPRQGGTEHINERWQDYWADLFAAQGYRAIDCVRPAVWDDPTVAPWYAQNAILYAADSVQIATPASPLPLRVVHPGVFLKQLDEPLPPRRLGRMVRVSARKIARETLRRR